MMLHRNILQNIPKIVLFLLFIFTSYEIVSAEAGLVKIMVIVMNLNILLMILTHFKEELQHISIIAMVVIHCSIQDGEELLRI